MIHWGKNKWGLFSKKFFPLVIIHIQSFCQPEPPDSSYMCHLGCKILEPTYIFGFL